MTENQTFTSTERPTYTPWGYADQADELAPGIWSVSTPGHGGLILSPERNACVAAYWRSGSDGAYEEDCEWSIVALTFPDAFKPEHVSAAHDTLRNWRPHDYARHTGKPVDPATSRELQREAFERDHAESWVVTSAMGRCSGGGTWGTWIPEGMVCVFASQPTTWKANGARGPSRCFLVPAPEYATRGAFGFVIDETRHAHQPGRVGFDLHDVKEGAQ